MSLTVDARIGLAGGVIRLALENATGDFQVWLPEWWDNNSIRHPAELLLDTGGRSERCFTMDAWRRIVRRTGVQFEQPVLLLSSRAGHADLFIEYVNEHNGARIRDFARQRITSVPPPFLPDYTRDGRIDADDVADFLAGRPFRFWMNEDCDKGDYIGQFPDVRPNIDLDSSVSYVKGRYDLINLFPVRLDVRALVAAYGESATVRIKSEGGCLRYCLADLSPDQVGKVYRDDVQTLAGEPLHNAHLCDLPSQGLSLQSLGLTDLADSPAMLVLEAIGPVGYHESPQLSIEVGNRELLSFRLESAAYSVRMMYRWINTRHLSGQAEVRGSATGQPLNNPEVTNAVRKLIFLHGANVSEVNAGKWGDQVFKRLWLSGADMDFYNVDWRSDIGLTGANYQQNASNAFAVAAVLAPMLSAIPGEKVIMAHSLGNMVVSSMIQDHGLVVSKYLMCNSAVPSEAYDPDPSLRAPQLVHPDWEDYPERTWTSNWHSLFDSFPDDDRRLLGWPGRFADVAQYAVNFYSTGDEVLELNTDNDLNVLTGAADGLSHLSWHKQEIFKGRAQLTSGLGGTDWSGWGFHKIWIPTLFLPAQVVKYNSNAARDLSEAQLRADPVFNPYPSSMTNNVIPLLTRAAHLTQGIPALAPPTGSSSISGVLGDSNNFDLNSDDALLAGIARPHDWPCRSTFSVRWLHSDMKDVAYYFNYRFYEKIIEKGLLR